MIAPAYGSGLSNDSGIRIMSMCGEENYYNTDSRVFHKDSVVPVVLEWGPGTCIAYASQGILIRWTEHHAFRNNRLQDTQLLPMVYKALQDPAKVSLARSHLSILK